MDESIRQFARQVIETEARAVAAMVQAVGEDFERAARLILDCPSSVLTSGVGKAGHVARKLSATLASTGTPSHFLSAADAVHGDLGSIRKGDIVLILSASGESDRSPWRKPLKRIDYWRTVISTKSSFSHPLNRRRAGYTDRWGPRGPSDLEVNAVPTSPSIRPYTLSAMWRG